MVTNQEVVVVDQLRYDEIVTEQEVGVVDLGLERN